MEFALPAEAATPPASPPFAKRAGHALLLHFPLLWRAHLHYAALAALGCWAACLAAAYLVPADPKHLWTRQQIDALQAALLLIVSMTAGAWARLQLRYPCPSQRFGVQLRLSALNVAILLAIVSSLNTGSLVFARRMASAVPKPEVDALAGLSAPSTTLTHCYRGSWVVDFGRRALLPTVKSVAEQMGFRMQILSCQSPLRRSPGEETDEDTVPVLAITAPDGAQVNALFWERLRAVRAQQRLVEQKDLPWWATTASFALFIAAIVWIRSMPSAQRHRWRLRRPRWCHAPRMPFRPFAAYERYLLLRHPQAWVIETHRVLVRGGFAALLAAPLSSLSKEELWLGCFLAVSAGSIVVFQLIRIFHRLCAYRLALYKWWLRAGLTLTLLAFGLGLSWAMAIRHDKVNISDLLLALLVLFGAPLCSAGVLASTLPRTIAVSVWWMGVAVSSLGLALSDYLSWFSGAWVALALVCWVVQVWRPATLPLYLFVPAIFVVASFPMAGIASIRGAQALGMELESSEKTVLVLGWLACFALMQGSCGVLARNLWSPRPK
jgi:hypothetical protein